MTTPRLLRTADELATDPPLGARAVVMTMGALHAGHAALINQARNRVGPHGQVVVTVFVNPLQFGAGEDYEQYPRTLETDLRTAGKAGADVVFAPEAATVYPGYPQVRPQVRIAAGPMGERFEGARRPGHFDGMLTVVAKLLHLTSPDIALYGAKDAQQLALIRRMVADLNFPVGIASVPTVREDDGLALSSRNRYLSRSERATALTLPRALTAGRDRLAAEAVHSSGRNSPSVRSGTAPAGRAGPQPGPETVRDAAQTVLDEAASADPPLELDYLALVTPDDFEEIPADYRGDALLAVAARVGGTRLIDNVRLTFGAER